MYSAKGLYCILLASFFTKAIMISSLLGSSPTSSNTRPCYAEAVAITDLYFW